MKVFSKIEQFESFIEVDAKRNDFTPVRFINVDIMGTWVMIKKFLSKRVSVTFKLSDSCANEDIAPNLNQLKRKVRLTETSSLVIPLSEYLRINAPIAKKTIEDFLHADYVSKDKKVRIYIPLYRMHSILDTVDLDPREGNCVLSINEAEESDYALTIVQSDLKVQDTGNDIYGYKKYFVYWEQNPDKPIILHTKTAVNYSDIVFSDNVEVIISTYGLLQHYGLTSELKKELGTEQQWEFFSSFFVEDSSLDTTMGQALRVMKYQDSLFRDWKRYDINEKWLLWLWAKMRTQDNFLKRVLIKNQDFNKFSETIVYEIASSLDTKAYENDYRARRDYMITMNIKPSSEQLKRMLGNMNSIDKIKCLTDWTDEEKRMILSAYAENSEDLGSALMLSYPMMANYLEDDLELNNKFIAEYFKEYKESKAKNKASDALLGLVEKNAEDNCLEIWSLSTRNRIIDAIYDDNSIIWFVDALGAEYVSALRSCFDSKIYDVKVYYGHSNLPSVTEYNNDFYEDKNHMEPYYKLDRWKHSNCDYPESFVQELNYINEIAEDVKKEIENRESIKVIVAGDHGTSRFAFMNKGEQYPAGNNAKIFKYGRYCLDTEEDYSEKFGCIQQDDYWIFANYSKFIQKGAPICEIHGGASVEEMVVPIFEIKLASVKTEEDIVEITLLTKRIKLPINHEITIMFSLSKTMDHVFVRIGIEKYECKLEDNKYSYIQKVVDDRNEFVGKVISAGKIIGEIKYMVDKPVQRNSKFDI